MSEHRAVMSHPVQCLHVHKRLRTLMFFIEQNHQTEVSDALLGEGR